MSYSGAAKKYKNRRLAPGNSDSFSVIIKRAGTLVDLEDAVFTFELDALPEPITLTSGTHPDQFVVDVDEAKLTVHVLSVDTEDLTNGQPNAPYEVRAFIPSLNETFTVIGGDYSIVRAIAPTPGEVS